MTIATAPSVTTSPDPDRVAEIAARDADAPNPELTLMIDGLCPLCRREGEMLRKMDKGRGRLGFIDITDPDFDPAKYGKTQNDVMGSIHAVTRNGEIVTGPEVFRRAYALLGWGWLWAWTRWPIVRPVVDFLYRQFARIRPRLSAHKRDDLCADGRCSI